MAPQHYFLLILDLSTYTLEVKDFETDFERAVAEYEMYEERDIDNGRYDIVLVGAESLDAVRTTHARYFAQEAKESGDDIDDMLSQLQQTP